MASYEQQQTNNLEALGNFVAPTLTQNLNIAFALRAIADDFIGITGEVFARHDAGSDVVSGKRIAGGAVLLAAVGGGAYSAGALTPWFLAYSVAFLTLAIYYRLKCGRTGLDGPHTEFMGYNWLVRLKPDLHSWPWTFATWGEPALVALIGIGLAFIDPVLGVWIVIVASSMRRNSMLMYKWEKRIRKQLKNSGIEFGYWLGNTQTEHPGLAHPPTTAGRVR